MSENYRAKILQFGEGNFLRAFVDYFIDIFNEKTGAEIGVHVVKPIPYGSLEGFALQNNEYNVVLKGKCILETRHVSCINSVCEYDENDEVFLSKDLEFVVSNTTEAGIAYKKDEDTFPRKITYMLYSRFCKKLPGLIFLPVELIEKNGCKLMECVLKYADDFSYPEEFLRYVKEDNIFCNTLVDRIVTGFTQEESDRLNDKIVTVCEPFALWVIESEKPEMVQKALPLDSVSLPVIFTKDLTPYRSRKVRILNGAHTSMVPYAMLKGFKTVGECVNNPQMLEYVKKCVFDDIIPTLDLPKQELIDYANDVLDRFANPYIEHKLSSIALNSYDKFKVRVMPSILRYKELFGKYPETLMTAFNAFYEFYQTDMANDIETAIDFMRSHTKEEVFKELCR